MIEFTQHLRLLKQTHKTSIPMPPNIVALARELQAAGFSFECEVFLNDRVSFEICKPFEVLLAHEVSDNGPPVSDAIERLFTRAHRRFKTNDYDGAAEVSS